MNNPVPKQPTSVINECHMIIVTDLLVPIETHDNIQLKYEQVYKKVGHYYLLIHKFISPIVVNSNDIDPIRKCINDHILKSFSNKNNIWYNNIFQPFDPLMAIQYKTESPRYEFELIEVPVGNVLYALIYSNGEITMSKGNLPLDEISTVLKDIRKLEVNMSNEYEHKTIERQNELYKNRSDAVYKIESKTLFEIEIIDEFVRTTAAMDASELRQHLFYANTLIKKLGDQLEDLSYEIAEFEKHGRGNK